MLNIAVIGCGIVAGGHLNAIKALTEWDLAAVVDTNPQNLQKAVEDYLTNIVNSCVKSKYL